MACHFKFTSGRNEIHSKMRVFICFYSAFRCPLPLATCFCKSFYIYIFIYINFFYFKVASDKMNVLALYLLVPLDVRKVAKSGKNHPIRRHPLPLICISRRESETKLEPDAQRRAPFFYFTSCCNHVSQVVS